MQFNEIKIKNQMIIKELFKHYEKYLAFT